MHLLSYPRESKLGIQHQGWEDLPGKCLTGCCFQSRWWYYILSGLRRRGSPVGVSRRPGEVCWSLRGAAHTHTHNIHTDGQYQPAQQPLLVIHTNTRADCQTLDADLAACVSKNRRFSFYSISSFFNYVSPLHLIISKDRLSAVKQ